MNLKERKETMNAKRFVLLCIGQHLPPPAQMMGLWLEKLAGRRSLKSSLLEQYFFTSRKNKKQKKFVYLRKRRDRNNRVTEDVCVLKPITNRGRSLRFQKSQESPDSYVRNGYAIPVWGFYYHAFINSQGYPRKILTSRKTGRVSSLLLLVLVWFSTDICWIFLTIMGHAVA